MKRIIVNSFGAVVMAFLCAVVTNAQQATAPSAIGSNHEVLIQILVASNDAGRSDLPANLEPLSRKLRGDLGFSNFRLVLTQLNRVSSNGFLETKGISPFGQNLPDTKLLNFYEFTVNFGEVGADKSGDSMIQIPKLAFGIRVPVVKSGLADGKETQFVNYEQLFLRANSISVGFNEPSVIGTLTTSRPNEALVLVITVKPDASGNRQTARKN